MIRVAPLMPTNDEKMAPMISNTKRLGSSGDHCTRPESNIV